jgi:hypothetical protein
MGGQITPQEGDGKVDRKKGTFRLLGEGCGSGSGGLPQICLEETGRGTPPAASLPRNRDLLTPIAVLVGTLSVFQLSCQPAELIDTRA